MDKLVEYLKSLNPQKDEQAILIYGRQYKLWRDGKYLGIATWEKDNNVGDSFQTLYPDKDQQGNVIMITQVWVADKWELIINKKES